jgi:MFS transporter, MHS family, proline/betaine transporter
MWTRLCLSTSCPAPRPCCSLLGGYFVLIVPVLYLMQGGFALACVAAVIGVLPMVIVQSVGYPVHTELFRTRVRYTGVSLAFNIATVLGAGTAPTLLRTWWMPRVTGCRLGIS